MAPVDDQPAGGTTLVAGHPEDMVAYADDLTKLDMAVGEAAYNAAPTLQALFERQTREVHMPNRPVPTTDDWTLARRTVDHMMGATESDRWVGTVGRALRLADSGGASGPYLPSADVSERELDAALAKLVPPLSATGNRWDPKAAYAAWGNSCPPDGSGVLVGPDGRTYVVAKPGPGPVSKGPSVGPSDGAAIPDDGPGSGWATVGSRQGDLVLGKPLNGFEKFAIVAGAAVGGGQKMTGWQSLGANQSQYITTYPHGGATVNNGATPPYQYGKPPEIKAPPKNGVETGQGGLDIAIGALEGANNVQQAENNRHYVSQVVFQEHVDGHRRAVVVIYQVQSDGSKVRVGQRYGTINPDGTVS